MADISEETIKQAIPQALPGRTVVWAIQDQALWYIFAPSTDSIEGDINPYFTLDLQGNLSEFFVVQNLEKFNEILQKVQKRQA